jgi:pimeloyl-ACP methyl ester carboxylesterase
MPTPQLQNFLRLAEVPRAGLEIASLAASSPWLGLSPRGDKHPVVVIPGFLADDDSTGLLRRFLSYLGYAVHPWAQGRNLGAARMGGYEPLVNHVLDIYRRTQKKVSLVGWSLGGVHAVAVADRAAYAVRQLVTLGSPLVQSGETSAMFETLRATARQLNGQILATPPNSFFSGQDALLRISKHTPITAIYSRTDGVVPWHRSHIHDGPSRDNIEVYSSHIGLGFNPAVLYAVADRLAQPADQFDAFHRNGWRTLTYPQPRPHKPVS